MKRWLMGLALVGGCLFVAASVAVADPLITGDLAVYYDFEGDWVDVVPDQSGNPTPFDGEVLRGATPGQGRVFASDVAKRGDQSAVFDSLGYFLPAVTTPTADPTAFPDDALFMGTDDPANWGPAVTLAAWVKLTRYGNPGSGYSALCDPACAKDNTMGVIEIRSASGGFVTHFEARTGDGKIRGRLRGELQAENINGGATGDNAFAFPPDGIWPEDTWFHMAETYDQNATFGGQPGHWALYVNGQIINQSYADGTTDGFPTGAIELGGWGQGGFVGRVQDDNRQLNGYMDEMYIFTRALSQEEIQTLYEMPSPFLLGDVNLDGAVNGLDVSPFVDKVISGEYQGEADTNEDGAVNGLDVTSFVDLVISGGTEVVPEPSTMVLAGLAALGLVWFGRRRV